MWEIIIQISTPTQKQISAAVNFHQLVVGKVWEFFWKSGIPWQRLFTISTLDDLITCTDGRTQENGVSHVMKDLRGFGHPQSGKRRIHVCQSHSAPVDRQGERAHRVVGGGAGAGGDGEVVSVGVGRTVSAGTRNSRFQYSRGLF